MLILSHKKEPLRNNPPRIVIGGTTSGAGKTSVTLALVSALRKRGFKVQTFKVGPDYLDPSYLTAASGRPCYNLDGWMTGKDYVCGLFAEKAADADISIIEGVMGLFDGSDPVGPEGSTAEIAAWLDAPVLLVVDVYGIARSIAAMVKGYAELDPAVRIAGVIANHCGSEGHAKWLSQSLTCFGLPDTVASLKRGSLVSLPSRHLGLVTADTRTFSDDILTSLGTALETQGDVNAIVEIAQTAQELPFVPILTESVPSEQRVRLGLAYDEAFHFYYPDNLEALQSRGCKLIRFSPIRDACLPEKLDGIYLGGGYPEEHAEQLSGNKSMFESVARFAESGKPVYAECGGLMYLSQGIESLEGERFAMAGILPAWTSMRKNRMSLGYVEITLAADSLLGCSGTKIRGHEFHYSELIDDPTASGNWEKVYRLRYCGSDKEVLEGFQKGNILAGYVHAHFASRPAGVEHFVSVCVDASKKVRNS